MYESEEKPLLQAKETQRDAAINLGMPRWLALSFAIFVTSLHTSSVVLSMYVMNQYSYQTYMKEKYPTSSHKSTGSQSACELNTSTIAYKEQVVVQKLTSELNIYCSLATYNVIGVIFTLNLATYSDIYGRKLFFIAPFIGTLLKTLLCTITIYFNLKLEWIILFFCIEGCTGTWVSTLSMAYSFMADLTEPGKPRTFVIGCFETSLGIAAFIVSLLSGYLIKWTDGFFYPSLISTAMVLLGLLIVIFILPETLHDSKKRSDVSFIQNMVRVTDVYKKGFSPDGKQWMFIILIVIFMMSNLANIARPQIETLYQLNSPFCWSAVRIGWYGSMRLGLLNIGNLAMIYLFHLCTTDEYIVLASLLTTVVSLTIEGLATTDFMLYLALGTGVGSSLGMAMSRAIMSRITPDNKQGSVFAGVAVPEIVFSLVSSLGANAIYDATVSIYRGLTFFIMAGYGFIGIILCLILIWGQKGYKMSKDTTRITTHVAENDKHVVNGYQIQDQSYENSHHF